MYFKSAEVWLERSGLLTGRRSPFKKQPTHLQNPRIDVVYCLWYCVDVHWRKWKLIFFKENFYIICTSYNILYRLLFRALVLQAKGSNLWHNHWPIQCHRYIRHSLFCLWNSTYETRYLHSSGITRNYDKACKMYELLQFYAALAEPVYTAQ